MNGTDTLSKNKLHSCIVDDGPLFKAKNYTQ